MKGKTLVALLVILAMVVSMNFTAFAKEEVQVFVDDRKVEFDVPPQLIGGRTMVPLRAIFEALGATVLWDDATATVTAYNEAYLVKATIGQNIMTVNGEEKYMDVAPMEVDGRTLVPARFVAESFNCDVLWDGESRTVTITAKPIDYNELEKDTNKAPEKPEQTPSDLKYYEGRNIPTYTSVTGVALKESSLVEKSVRIHRYNYTNKDDVFAYWDALIKKGYELISEDDKTTEDIYETTFADGSLFVYVYIAFNLGEVWVSYPDSIDSTETEANSNSKYYEDTNIPTYTSVTGVALKERVVLEDGAVVFKYNFTNTDDVNLYWTTIRNAGYTALSGDNEETDNIFETIWQKENSYVMVYVRIDYGEVWIACLH